MNSAPETRSMLMDSSVKVDTKYNAQLELMALAI